MKDIKFTTQPLKGALSKSSDDCRCVIIHNELVNDDSIAKDMAETLGIDETNAQMHISLVVKYILGEYYISLRTRCGDNSLPAPSADRRLVKVFA